MSHLRGLDHMQLAIPPGGEARARRFYGQILGLEEEAKPEPLAQRGGLWFHGPAIIVHLGLEQDFVPARKAHPAFLVADIDALARDLLTAGFPVRWSDELPDRRRFYSDDPFGNRIEFIAEPDGFSRRPAATGR